MKISSLSSSKVSLITTDLRFHAIVKFHVIVKTAWNTKTALTYVARESKTRNELNAWIKVKLHSNKNE